MTISRFLSGSIAILALIACGLGTMVAVETWGDMQATSIAKDRLAALRALANIPASVNPERGTFALQMSTVAPGDSSQHAVLISGEKLTDAAFAEAKLRVAVLCRAG